MTTPKTARRVRASWDLIPDELLAARVTVRTDEATTWPLLRVQTDDVTLWVGHGCTPDQMSDALRRLADRVDQVAAVHAQSGKVCQSWRDGADVTTPLHP